MQRGFEILLRKAPELDQGALIAWLTTVVKREALAVRAARERTVTPGWLTAEPDRGPREPAAGGLEPFEAVVLRERVGLAAAALRDLRPAERRAIGLYAAGCGYAEIQAITGWTYTKVNRCLREGRERLRDQGRLLEVA